MGNCMEAAFEGQHLRTADSAAALVCPSLLVVPVQATNPPEQHARLWEACWSEERSTSPPATLETQWSS